MKFTSEDFLDWLGLKVGDRVKVKIDECNITNNSIYENFEIIQQKYMDIPVLTNTNGQKLLEFLLDRDFEILPQPKKVGDLKCKDFECSSCPIRALINCNKADNQNQSLFDNLSEWTSEYLSFDQEIYDLLKARLDRVVFERQDNMEVKDND